VGFALAPDVVDVDQSLPRGAISEMRRWPDCTVPARV